MHWWPTLLSQGAVMNNGQALISGRALYDLESDRWKFLFQVLTTNRNKSHCEVCTGFDTYPSWSLGKTGDQKYPQRIVQGIKNNEECVKMPFKIISWSPRIPTKYCSKLYVLRVTSAVLYSWHAWGMKVIVCYTSASQWRERFKKAGVRRENVHKQERRDLLWETDISDFFTHN